MLCADNTPLATVQLYIPVKIWTCAVPPALHRDSRTSPGHPKAGAGKFCRGLLYQKGPLLQSSLGTATQNSLSRFSIPPPLIIGRRFYRLVQSRYSCVRTAGRSAWLMACDVPLLLLLLPHRDQTYATTYLWVTQPTHRQKRHNTAYIDIGKKGNKYTRTRTLYTYGRKTPTPPNPPPL